MGTTKNSAYKLQAGVVPSTTGLNLEAGALVHSIADGGLMYCDGTSWIAVGGGGGGSLAQLGVSLAGGMIAPYNVGPPQTLPVTELFDIVVYNIGSDFTPANPNIGLAIGKYRFLSTWNFFSTSFTGSVQIQAVFAVGGSLFYNPLWAWGQIAAGEALTVNWVDFLDIVAPDQLSFQIAFGGTGIITCEPIISIDRIE